MIRRTWQDIERAARVVKAACDLVPLLPHLCGGTPLYVAATAAARELELAVREFEGSEC